MIVKKYSTVQTINLKNYESNTKLINKNSLSEFDMTLVMLWNQKMQEGLFKYKFKSNSADYKKVYKTDQPSEADLPYLVHINKSRHSQYKKPKKVPFSSINEKFNGDPTKFSFLKINQSEILFKLSGKFSKDHVVINSAPLEIGHILLLPEVEKKHRQCLTLHALESALNLLKLSGSSYFKLMFNSLQAGASVNHLHIHGMYSRFDKHSDNLEREKLVDNKNVFKTRRRSSINQAYIISDIPKNEETNLKNIYKLV